MSGDEHADLPTLLSGDLSPALRATGWAHVRSCATCRVELVETASLISELRDASRFAPVDPAEVPPFRLDGVTAAPVDAAPVVREPRTNRWLTGRAAVGVAAGVLSLFVGLGIGLSTASSTSPARVALAAVGTLPSTASGAAQMSGSGQGQVMNLTVTGLETPPDGDHYEVWLLDTRTGRTIDVGQLPPGAGVRSYPLPASEAVGYDALDISLQSPADGARHSGHSLLRGSLA